MKKLYLVIFALLVFVGYSNAQMDTMTIGSFKNYPTLDSITIPVTVSSNFKNIASIGLYIVLHDSNTVKFGRIANIHPQLAGNALFQFYKTSPTGPSITMGWYTSGTTGIDFGQTTLFDIICYYKGPNAFLCFDTVQCSIADNNLNNVPMVYNCGYLNTLVGVNNNNPATYAINIFPNPSNGNINLTYKEKSNLQQISVYNLSGERVYNVEVNSAQNIYNLDLSDLSKGMYLLKLTSKDNVNYKKIILQ